MTAAPILERQRAAFMAEGPPSARLRRDRLRRLERLLTRHADAIASAVSEDFGNRARQETTLGDLLPTIEGIRHLAQHLESWMRPERRRAAWYYWPSRARIVAQPLGVVGVIAPWNYPIGLSIFPLAAALAAGNRVMVKPSEFTPRTSALVAALVADTFAVDEVSVITGDAEVAAAFSRLPFDHLLFTGGTAVGRKVMEAASANLVPVTLELGGKSPVIVDRECSVESAARAVARGKLFNAGQTCIAPDYALVPADVVERFIDAFFDEAGQRYPDPLRNPDYASIVNDRHFARLQALVAEATAKGARVWPSGENAESGSRRLGPTLITDVHDEMAVMQEEIFGPILPVQTYDRIEEAIASVNRRPRPLALYLFSDHAERQRLVLGRTVSGGVTVNETMLHFMQRDLPFGGVGASGMGAYHAREGFLTFSHRKAVFEHSALSPVVRLIQPPYGSRFDRLVGALMR
jgi:coniferyl-aldehyde dehydrogenase